MQQTVDKAILAPDPGAVIAVGIAFGVEQEEAGLSGTSWFPSSLRLV